MVANNRGELNGGSALTVRPSPQVVFAKSQMSRTAENSSDVGGVFHAIRRHWKLSFFLGILMSALGAFAGWKLLIPTYSASSFLKIDSSNRPLIFETAEHGAGTGVTGFKLYKNTQMQIIMTPFVLNAALRKDEIKNLPGVANNPDALTWLQENLKVTFPGDTELMQITVETPEAQSCVKLVNAIVDSYMSEVVVHERNQRLQRRDSLERVRAETEHKVRSKRSELKALADVLRTGDSGSLNVAQQSTLQQFGLMQEKLSEVEFQLMQSRGELKILEDMQSRLSESAKGSEPPVEKGVSAEEPPLEILESDLRSADVVRLEEEVALLEIKVGKNESMHGSRHPSIRTLIDELRVRREQLARYKQAARVRAEELAKQRQALAKSVKQGSNQVEDANAPIVDPNKIMGLQSKIEVLQLQEKSLQEKVNQLSSEAKSLGQSSIDVDLMRSEIKGFETVLANVGSELEKTEVELKTQSRISVVDSAKSATPPDLKKRLAATVGMGAFGLFLPAICLVGWDIRSRKANDLATVTKSLDLPSLGSIPVVTSNPLERMNNVPANRRGRQKVELTESIDAIAAMVMHRAMSEDKSVFIVTSAMPGEGKSTVSCQLSESLARSGKSVLLVDCDLRRPSVSKYLKISNEPGVGEVLLGECLLADAIQSTRIRNLSVLAAGESLGSLTYGVVEESLKAVFDQLRDEYDLIIVDSCPVLPVADTRVIGKYCDGAIFTMVRDKSRVPMASAACEVLKSHGANIAGVVMIGGRSQSEYGYYQYYGRGRPRDVQDSPT